MLTVGELGRVLKRALDQGFSAPVWVEGEVSGARGASSGHLYFTLKDEGEEATIDVAMYRTNLTPRARSLVKDGAKIRMRGKPDFWAPRGRTQFIADRIDPVGKGALLEALEKLREKLAKEGLFATERKRALPHDPRVIGVVTSAGGAAIHDVCRVAFRRGGARILLAPALVQGAGAAQSICSALAMLQRVAEVDVIIVGRGGGSSDDLSAFQEETVVRAVAACRVPIVSAVGHEVDVTLTDFVADVRAATPSQAAELVVPDRRARRAQLDQTRVRLARAMRGRVTEDRLELGRLMRKVSDPRLAIAASQQALDERQARLEQVARRALTSARDRRADLASRLLARHPIAVIRAEQAALARTKDRLVAVGSKSFAARAGTVERLAARLDAMSPLKVLARGYAIATDARGHALRAATDVRPGDRVEVRLHRGHLEAEVVLVHDARENDDAKGPSDT